MEPLHVRPALQAPEQHGWPTAPHVAHVPPHTPFHCPQLSQTTEEQLGHTELGVQTGGEAQEHVAHVHVTEHVSLP